jgi:hypothetical protein
VPPPQQRSHNERDTRRSALQKDFFIANIVVRPDSEMREVPEGESCARRRCVSGANFYFTRQASEHTPWTRPEQMTAAWWDMLNLWNTPL